MPSFPALHRSMTPRPELNCRHWPLDLIELHSTISRPHLPSFITSASSSSSSSTPRPLRLILHLSNPPNEKLLLPNNVEACKTQFLNQLKEADFVRWRNTNKVTSLRRADLEAGWDGIVQGESFCAGLIGLVTWANGYKVFWLGGQHDEVLVHQIYPDW